MVRRWLLAIGFGLFATAAPAQDATTFKSDLEKRSYALGMNLAAQLEGMSIKVDAEILSQALKDALSGGNTRLTKDEVRTIVAGLQDELKAKQAEVQRGKMTARQALADKNQKEGDAFLARNRTREGVVTLASGLQYKVLTAGAGPKPTIDDSVVCHYRGTFVDGREFDSSISRNQPGTFPVKRVIKGWTEALQLMPVGSKWQIVVPSGLAYGALGSGTRIGPNATLVFEIELLSIEHGAASADVVASEDAPAPAIAVEFKLDPRLSGATYGGARWVSPQTYSIAAQDGGTCRVEARTTATGPKNEAAGVAATWTASDPDMVSITSGEKNQATITIGRVGSSTIDVSAIGLSTRLHVTAVQGKAAVECSISPVRK